jgi:hypothetical protein
VTWPTPSPPAGSLLSCLCSRTRATMCARKNKVVCYTRIVEFFKKTPEPVCNGRQPVACGCFDFTAE